MKCTRGGTIIAGLQKIRLGFLFHLAEEFDWQKGACTMPYVTGSWISVEREGRERGKGEEESERDKRVRV